MFYQDLNTGGAVLPVEFEIAPIQQDNSGAYQPQVIPGNNPPPPPR